jgi:hypothetical protein
MALNGYYDRFDKSKNYEKTMFLAGRGLQSAELNEVQEYAISRISGIGDDIFADGDVINGSTCVVNPDIGSVIIEAGYIYLRGTVREVPEANFTIPTDRSVVTELEDLADDEPQYHKCLILEFAKLFERYSATNLL